MINMKIVSGYKNIKNKTKDFIMSSSGRKWLIMLITFIGITSLSLYVELKLFNAMKEDPYFGVWLFLGCAMYFPWLVVETHTFILLGSLFLKRNSFAELKDYFKWLIVDILWFIIIIMVSSLPALVKIKENGFL